METITCKIISDPEEEFPDGGISLFGGDPDNPSWEEYLDGFKNEYRPHIQAIREAVIKSDIFGVSAMAACNATWFKLSDGTSISFSFRGWGDLMQAIKNNREGYMAYY